MFYFSGKPESAFRPDIILAGKIDSWWRADSGVSGADWTDRISGKILRQNTGTIATTTMRGQAAVVLDGTKYLVSQNTAASWKFLHDGSGSTVMAVARYTNPALAFGQLVDTSNSAVAGAAASTGISLAMYSGASFVYYECDRANATPTNAINGRVLSYIGPQIVIIRSKTGGSPNACSYFNNGRMFLAAYGGAASSSNPGYTLHVGTTAGGHANGWIGHVEELLFCNQYLTDLEHEQLETYIAERYGYSPVSGQ